MVNDFKVIHLKLQFCTVNKKEHRIKYIIHGNETQIKKRAF